MLVVRGTTWTRFRNLLAASLLAITAGRRSCISPPTAGPKSTHQTSPRIITDISYKSIGPFQRLSFLSFIFGHLAICGLKLLINEMWTDSGFYELTDVSAPNDPV